MSNFIKPFYPGHKNRLIHLAILGNLLVIGLFIFFYANKDYPLVGHDFRLFIPRLLDSHLHYKVAGLTIQWYTPSFGGGLPAYANPLQAQFSLPQLLTWFMDPWKAILFSSIIFAILGFLALYNFLNKSLDCSPLASILGGAVFILNGFFIERVVIGHVNFISFPLISIILFALFNQKQPAWLSGSLIGLTSAVIVYSGGVYIGVIGVFSCFMILPMLYFVKPSLLSFRRLAPILLWGAIFSVLLCGSKLYATSTFMANFPREVRDEYLVNWLTGLGGLIFQLIGVMTTVPLLSVVGKSGMVFVARLGEWIGSPYSFWELDSSISPILLFLLGYGAWNTFRRKPTGRFTWGKLFAAVFLTLSILLAAEFSMAKGWLFQSLRTLPVLESLHANTRFTASFVLPLAILGAIIFNNWVAKFNKLKNSLLVFLVLDILALLSPWAYFSLPSEVQLRNFETDEVMQAYEQIQAGDWLPVTMIIPEMNDYEVLLYGASNTVRHYEPLFRDNNEAFHPTVHEGSVYELIDGFYNLTNPTGYLFPEENETAIYERFRETELAQLELFINHQQPKWAIPVWQMAANWSALICLLSIITGIGFYFFRTQIPIHWGTGKKTGKR